LFGRWLEHIADTSLVYQTLQLPVINHRR
jgi:hypothetical protein